MIDVSVAQHDGINLPGIEREIAVALDGFTPPALKQTALQQQPTAVEFHEKH
jgi:hypothetical protein